MSVYGASFVRARPDRETAFRETCRSLRASNASWLAASPTNLVSEHTVRSSAADWIIIEDAVGDTQLAPISRALGTTAITIYAVDEKSPRFSYSRLEEGRAVRVLAYEHAYPHGGRWTIVDGEPEPWEEWGREIAPGLSDPSPCDLRLVAEIANAMNVPWDPIAHQFPPAAQIEVIPGCPERTRAFFRRHHRPWWRFWD